MVNDELTKHLIGLVTNEPFYSSVSQSADKFQSEDIPTACVEIRKSGEICLFWNRDYVKSLSSLQTQELLKHEFLHLVLGHLTARIRLIHGRPDVWFWSTDLVVNCLLNIANLPPGGILPGEFKSIPPEDWHLYSSDFLECHEKLCKVMRSLPYFKSAEWYFNKLSKDPDVIKAIEQLSTKKKNHHHSLWRNLSNHEQKIAQKKINNIFTNAIERAEKETWGTVPYSARRILLQRASLEAPWKELLRYVCGLSRSAERSRSFKKISRRHPLFPGLKRKRTGRIAVAVDMSASVTDGVLSQVFGVLFDLADYIDFTVIPFDSIVEENQIFVWKKGEKVSPERVRWGGTSFDAPTQWVNENREKFDAMFVITDGLADEPCSCLVPRFWILVPLTYLFFKTDEIVIRMDSKI